MVLGFQGLVKYFPKFIHVISLIAVIECFLFFSSKEISIAQYSLKYKTPLDNKVDWLIVDNIFCSDIDNLVPQRWNAHIRLNGEIFNCKTDKKYTDDYQFLEALIESKAERVGIFQRFPDDLFLWTDFHTLLIPNTTTSFGEVCRETRYSMTIETSDFKMSDWAIPFNIHKRLTKFNKKANVMLERSAFWFFPLMNDLRNIKESFGYLTQHSIIRNIDNQDIRNELSFLASNESWDSVTTLQFLKTLRHTAILNNTVATLERTNYEWPSLTLTERGKYCAPVLWKETAKKKTLEPNCHEIKLGEKKGQTPMRDDILLVVVYNRVHYENMPYVNSLYVKLFKYIAYCGPDEIPENYGGFFCGYKNIEGHLTGGFGQTCTSTYLAMRHKHTMGLFITADDILLNTHMLSEFSKDYMWASRSNIKDVRKIDKVRTWIQWRKYKQVIIQALTDLYESPDLSLRNCGRELEKLTGTKYTIGGGYSDLYFVPYTFTERFIKTNNHFLDYKIPFEISVPTVALCLAKNDMIKTSVLYPSKRHRQWEFINVFNRKLFFHPVKWGLMTKTNEEYKAYQNLFCRVKAYLHDVSKNTSVLDYKFEQKPDEKEDKKLNKTKI